MSVKRIDQSSRMSQASCYGDMVVLAGQISDKGNTVREQTEDIFVKIDALLKKAGTDKTKILYANIWLTDLKNYSEFNSVWEDWVVSDQVPSRACVQAILAKPEWLVEVQVFAVK